MSWLRLHRRSALLVGVTLLVPLFFYLKTLLGLLSLGFDYTSERNRIEPRLARLQGLLDNADELRRQSTVAVDRLNDLAFPAREDPSALAATLQADVRQIFTQAGLSVSNSQVMPARTGEAFDQVAVKLTVTGGLAALDGALLGVAAYRPRLLVESMDTFPARPTGRSRAGEAEQTLTAVLQLMVLRDLP